MGSYNSTKLHSSTGKFQVKLRPLKYCKDLAKNTKECKYPTIVSEMESHFGKTRWFECSKTDGCINGPKSWCYHSDWFEEKETVYKGETYYLKKLKKESEIEKSEFDLQSGMKKYCGGWIWVKERGAVWKQADDTWGWWNECFEEDDSEATTEPSPILKSKEYTYSELLKIMSAGECYKCICALKDDKNTYFTEGNVYEITAEGEKDGINDDGGNWCFDMGTGSLPCYNNDVKFIECDLDGDPIQETYIISKKEESIEKAEKSEQKTYTYSELLKIMQAGEKWKCIEGDNKKDRIFFTKDEIYKIDNNGRIWDDDEDYSSADSLNSLEFNQGVKFVLVDKEKSKKEVNTEFTTLNLYDLIAVVKLEDCPVVFKIVEAKGKYENNWKIRQTLNIRKEYDHLEQEVSCLVRDSTGYGWQRNNSELKEVQVTLESDIVDRLFKKDNESSEEILPVKHVVQNMEVGEEYECVNDTVSNNTFCKEKWHFKSGKRYKVFKNENGKIILGHLEEAWYKKDSGIFSWDRDVTFKKVKSYSTLSMKKGEEVIIKSPSEYARYSQGIIWTTSINKTTTLEGENMNQVSQKVLDKLNGLKQAEKNKVELVQDSSEGKTIKINIGSILKSSAAVEKLKAGEECIIEDIKVDGDAIVLSLSVGKVGREEK